MRFIKSNHLLTPFYETAITYGTPINLTIYWNFGIFALLFFGIQLLTGIFLAMHYIPNVLLAFDSIENIMRNVNYGWLLRYIHANGASFFFFSVYIHIFRGLYYGSFIYPRRLLWIVGVVIFLIMILTAFLGYVLPWGQMSFWAATVITNLASAIPIVGIDIVQWIWGGFSVDNATLNRFYSLHYLFPFIILALVLIHLLILHEVKSNNDLGINSFKEEKIPFSPYYVIKDLYYVIIMCIIFAIFIFFMPNYLGHPDNYIKANPLQTPAHIVPEWYFLPFYAILRSIPDKLLGVLGLVFSILILIFISFYTPIIKSNIFKPFNENLFFIFILAFILLGWLGGKSLEYPYLNIGFYVSGYYFLNFFICIPILNFLDKFIFIKENISNSIFIIAGLHKSAFIKKQIYLKKNIHIKEHLLYLYIPNRVFEFIMINFFSKPTFFNFIIKRSFYLTQFKNYVN